MSGYTYESTAVASDVDIQALPRTGREEAFGIVGNTVFFSRAPEKDIDEASEEVYLMRAFSPVGAELTVPAHWHPKTSEYFRVFAGSVDFTLRGVTHTMTANDGELYIPRGAVHSIRVRKDVHGEFGERADPNPVRKMRFLRRLVTRGGQAHELGRIQMMRVFYEDGDGYPSTGFRLLDVVLVYVLGGFFGSFLGLAKLPDTPEDRKSK